MDGGTSVVTGSTGGAGGAAFGFTSDCGGAATDGRGGDAGTTTAGSATTKASLARSTNASAADRIGMIEQCAHNASVRQNDATIIHFDRFGAGRVVNVSANKSRDMGPPRLKRRAL